MKAAIVAIAGPELLPHEAALLRAQSPAGVILFARNVHDPGQVASLVAHLRRVLPPDAVLMVDQEGGRVARLRPPHWRAHPPAAALGELFAVDHAAGLRAAWLTGALIGWECAQAGLDTVAAPVLDVRTAGASDVIGDRAFSADPVSVARLGRAFADGLLAAGIQSIGKHVPGHGRGLVDSHFALPRVNDRDLTADLLPFARHLHLPWLMTAHIIYTAWDPDRPATASATVIRTVIRGRLGFRGLLVTDDLAMNALSGPPAERATQALAAGCDLALYCAGDPDANAELLQACRPVSAETALRLAGARAMAEHRGVALDADALACERDRLLA